MPRILIIDDEVQVVEMLRSLYESNDFEVDTALDGQEGLDAYRKQPADVVIVDIRMPGKEGLETITEFGRELPEAKMIAITGAPLEAMNNFLQLARAQGAIYAFRKPFRLVEILDAANQIILESAQHVSTD